MDADARSHLKSLVEVSAKRGRKPAATITKEYLQTNVWWWNHIENASNHQNLHAQTEAGKLLVENFEVPPDELEWIDQRMRRCQRSPAYIYEIAVRMLEPKLIPLPWLRLLSEVKLPFIDAFEELNLFVNGISFVTPGVAQTDPFWTSEPCNLSFNLLLGEKILAELFLEWFIRPEKRRRGLDKRKPNQGNTGRLFSWRPIEFLDIQNFKLEPLSTSETSQISKARHEVGKALGIPVEDRRKTRGRKEGDS